MKSRCYSPSATKGKYKENNIPVCPEWMNSFENFYLDLGNCPEGYFRKELIILKIILKKIVFGQIELHKVKTEDFNDIVTYNGKTMVLKDWAKNLI